MTFSVTNEQFFLNKFMRFKVVYFIFLTLHKSAVQHARIVIFLQHSWARLNISFFYVTLSRTQSKQDIFIYFSVTSKELSSTPDNKLISEQICHEQKLVTGLNQVL